MPKRVMLWCAMILSKRESSGHTRPPRIAFLLAAYAFAATMLGTTLPTPLYPIYQAQMGFSQLLVTVIFAAYAAGVICALILFGGLSDQLGRKRLLLIVQPFQRQLSFAPGIEQIITTLSCPLKVGVGGFKVLLQLLPDPSVVVSGAIELCLVQPREFLEQRLQLRGDGL